MFEKIGRYAESVATNAGQSRRGFLERLGQAALGVAGLVGAVLVLPGKVGATVPPGSCRYRCPDGTFHSTDCKGGCQPSIQHAGMTCPIYMEHCYY